jgi:choline dehydrogenase-like flavoprotein
VHGAFGRIPTPALQLFDHLGLNAFIVVDREIYFGRRETRMVYDYVLAGGGSAGSALAARLSEDPKVTVCLIEAGGEGESVLVRAPIGVAAMLSGRPKINNWAFETVPQPGLNGRRGFQPRGKALGGSSAINGMIYIRGHRTDYDDWAALGCEGWLWNDVLPYFKRAEGNERGANDLHGGNGPLRVANQRSPRPITYAFVEACAENQIRRNDDFNGPEQEGAGLYQVTQFWGGEKNGERCSAAAAYLHPVMNRPNLTVITHAHATRIVFDGKRATGVRYHRNGRDETAEARREVILCGGAFGSPQLLLLSGVGPADELRQHGIGVFYELPGVGKNLQDHLDYITSYSSKHTDLFGLTVGGVLNLFRGMLQWRKDGTGIFASPGSEGAAFLKSDPGLDRPDLQLHFIIAKIADHLRKIQVGYGFSCRVCQLRPYSRGEVGLTSSDPLAPPRIDPRFLSDERDAEILLKGVKLVRRIVGSPALAKYRHKELLTADVSSDEELMNYIRNRADTIYHPVGTCKMGVDDMAVVDPQLRVRGLQGLRVVDASILPTLIGGNTNAAAIMIAEKAADMIRAA